MQTTRFPRRGWAITTQTLCGFYVDLTTDEHGRSDVLLHATRTDAEADLADYITDAREAVAAGDLTDYDPEGSSVVYVGVDRRGCVWQLDPLTGDPLNRLHRGDHPN